MWKRLRAAMVVAVAAAVVMPIALAVPFNPDKPPAVPAAPAAAQGLSLVSSPSAAPRTPLLVSEPGRFFFLKDVPDGLKLVIVGTMLFGLAAAVRKAV